MLKKILIFSMSFIISSFLLIGMIPISYAANSASLTVKSNTDWNAVILDGNQASYSFDGFGNDSFDIPCGKINIISVVLQKQTDYGFIAIQLIQNEKVLNQASTSAQYGVVSVASECQGFGGSTGSNVWIILSITSIIPIVLFWVWFSKRNKKQIMDYNSHNLAQKQPLTSSALQTFKTINSFSEIPNDLVKDESLNKIVRTCHYCGELVLQNICSGCRNEYLELIKFDNNSVINNSYAWNSKGITLNKQKEYFEAWNCFDKAIQIDPNKSHIWNNKGIALLELGKEKEASVCFDKALQIDQNYAAAWNSKGNLLNKQRKHEEAIECYDKAIKINQEYTKAWTGKGIALCKIGKSKEAIECYDKSEKLKSNS